MLIIITLWPLLRFLWISWWDSNIFKPMVTARPQNISRRLKIHDSILQAVWHPIDSVRALKAFSMQILQKNFSTSNIRMNPQMLTLFYLEHYMYRSLTSTEIQPTGPHFDATLAISTQLLFIILYFCVQHKVYCNKIHQYYYRKLK